MLSRILGALGLGGTGPVKPAAFAPYRDPARDAIYHLLFCDDPAAFRASRHGEPVGAWKQLFASPPDVAQLQRIARDPHLESRVRVLAYRLSASAGHPISDKALLGVVIERPMPTGLDVLAVYRDRSVRYLNHSGRMLFWEASDPVIDGLIDRVLEASERATASIGPWDKPRLAPPAGDTTRVTFLVADALYFGQGPSDVIDRDSIGGPVIGAATRLLSALVDKTTK